VTHANWGVIDRAAPNECQRSFSEITLDDLRTMEIDTMFRALRMLSEKLRRRSRRGPKLRRFRRGRRHDQEVGRDWRCSDPGSRARRDRRRTVGVVRLGYVTLMERSTTVSPRDREEGHEPNHGSMA